MFSRSRPPSIRSTSSETAGPTIRSTDSPVKLVMARRHGRVRREDAPLSHIFVVPVCGRRSSLPVHQFENQKACVTFIHVEALDTTVAQCTKHSYATDSEDCFLCKPVVPVTPVQAVRETAIVLAVVLDIGVQQKNGDLGAGDTDDIVLPGANTDHAAFDLHLHARGQ